MVAKGTNRFLSAEHVKQGAVEPLNKAIGHLIGMVGGITSLFNIQQCANFLEQHGIKVFLLISVKGVGCTKTRDDKNPGYSNSPLVLHCIGICPLGEEVPKHKYTLVATRCLWEWAQDIHGDPPLFLSALGLAKLLRVTS